MRKGVEIENPLGASLRAVPDRRRSLRNLLKRSLYAVILPLQRLFVKRKEELSLPSHFIPTQRGTEYDLLLSRLGTRRIRGSRVLLQGVGDGTEAGIWGPHAPRSLVGVDLEIETPDNSDVRMIEADLEDLPFPAEQFDIAASLNTFEHVQVLDKVLAETRRVLVDGGVFLASFGPLYHSYGGDHFSSLRGGFQDGYNHLLMPGDDYADYVRAVSVPGVDIVDSQPQAGLAYIQRDLFSHLTIDQYMKAFHASFQITYWKAHIEPMAREFRLKFPKEWKELLAAGYRELDLLASTLVVIGTKSRHD